MVLYVAFRLRCGSIYGSVFRDNIMISACRFLHSSDLSLLLPRTWKLLQRVGKTLLLK